MNGLPNPGVDIATTELWPAASDGVLLAVERSNESRQCTMLQVLQELRRDNLIMMRKIDALTKEVALCVQALKVIPCY